MKIKFIFIGENYSSPSSTETANTAGTSDPQSVADNVSALKTIVNPDNAIYSDANNKVAAIDRNNEFYNQALKYAYPDLNQEDFTPGYQKSAVVGEASNKTLGSFPIFSDAVIAPADLYSKRRKAITDFILDQERLKSQTPKQLDYPKYELGSGSPNVEGAINSSTLNKLQSNVDEFRKQGISMSGAGDDPNHPAYWPTQRIINQNKQRLDLSKALDKNAEEVRKLDLSSGNMFSRATQASLDMWDKFSQLSQEQQQAFFDKDKGDQYGITNSMQHWNRNMTSIPNLENVTNNYVSKIKEKAQSAIQSGESGGVQDFIINQLKSQYPLDALSKDKKGNIVYNQENQDKFLTSVATNIAKNKPELFNDFQKNNDGTPKNPDAPFSMSDLKDYIKDQLGYEYTTTVHTAATPGAAANATVSAVPTSIMSDISSKMSKGIPIDIGKNSQIIPGKSVVTYIDEKGNTTVIPKDNVPENINKMIELGVKDPTKFGGIDEASAKANILNSEETFNKFHTAMGSGRGVETHTGDVVKDFNSNMYEIAQNNYYPIAGSGIGVKSAENIKGSSNDDNFFFKYKDKEGANTGVIIPSDIMPSLIKEKGWLSFLGPYFDNDKKVVGSSSDGNNTTLSGTYYHKEAPDRNGVVNYTVYNSQTKTPYLVPDANGNKVPIVIPQSKIQDLTTKPAQLLQQSNSQFKPEEDRVLPQGVQSKTTANAATLKAKGQSVGATENVNTTAVDKFGNSSDDQIRAAHYLVSKTPGLTIDAALQSVKNGETSNDPNKKAKLQNIYQQMQGTSVDSIKSLYK